MWGNPCPPPFLPSLALSLFPSLPLFLSSSIQHRQADKSYSQEEKDATPIIWSLCLWMREGYHWLFIFAWTSHDSLLQPTGRKADCITGRVSMCFGAELWRRATWKHSPETLHAFSSSFAQSTGITGSGHQCVLMSVRVCLCVCLWVCVRLVLCLL